MAYKVQIEKSALKQLSKIEKRIQTKIAAKIDELAENPRPYGYKKLVDKDGTCRVKVSDLPHSLRHFRQSFNRQYHQHCQA